MTKRRSGSRTKSPKKSPPADQATPAADGSEHSAISHDAPTLSEAVAAAAVIGGDGVASPSGPPIVGIGASAGGLDAFERLIRRLPPRTGLAYVLVQHLDPTHQSLLPELIGRSSALPAEQAVDGMPIVVDRVYVIPPNTTMTIGDGHLRLVARSAGHGLHLPIDAFLCSLAAVQGSMAVGVILSGAGSDGSRGIEAIKEAGGITFAQDSESAQVASMPEQAVETGAVDFVLTPEHIADELARLGLHHQHDPGEETESSETPRGRDNNSVAKILSVLETRTGVDFQHYRRGTLQRRILRRMLVHRQTTRDEYLAYLRRDPAELDLLYQELLIGVTRFFRDNKVFKALQTNAFPAMLEAHARHTPVRVWVPGCASGEEAYSLAIALIEYLDEASSNPSIQIFGTDLSEAAITKARAGVYPASIKDDVSSARLQRFFIEESGGYRITKAVRDLCVFSRQNVVRDPPFSHLDLISCRNVFIYLQTELQRRVLPIFHYALEPNGLLLLGTAESVGSSSKYFESFDKALRIYRRRPTAVSPIVVDFATPASAPLISAPPRTGAGRIVAKSVAVDDVIGEADRAVFAQLMPPGVVINDRLEILQFRGDTARFLSLPPGIASLDLLKLARGELAMPLHSAILEAMRTGSVVRDSGIALPDGDGVREVAIAVHPFQPRGTSERFFAVLFTDMGVRGKARPAKKARRTREVATAFGDMQRELEATKRYLRDLTEQHEGITEELRAANEEIQSSNEELQSTNEELETTKEEVQSTNEELTTLNEELRHRNQELSALSADLSNILVSTTIPIVIVGADIRIRRLTPATDRVMRVIPSDTGRPLADVRLRVALPDLDKEITRVIETLALVEHEARDEEGRWWAITIRPYQTADRRVDGAVLVFTDIDVSKRYGERARQEVEEARLQLLEAAEKGRVAADEARKLAETANRAKSAFLASMSHDLRTPLNASPAIPSCWSRGCADH